MANLNYYHLELLLAAQLIDLVEANQRAPRKYIRDVGNPFEKFSNAEFKSRYRFDKVIVQETILPLILPEFEKRSNRGLPISPAICLLIALRFYATGSFRIVHADLRGISQSTLSRIIVKVSRAIASHFRRIGKFPADLRHVKEEFYAIAGFPRVIGCIDCMHIPIKHPGAALADIYRNKKGTFSINVQVVCGPKLEIFDLVARYPGSDSDSIIYNRSSLKMRFEKRLIGVDGGILLGDSEYSCLNHLLTPIENPKTNQEHQYNEAHIKTWNTVERLFGVMKERFLCLQRGLANSIDNIPAIVCACATLHNIAIQHNNADFNFENINNVNENENLDKGETGLGFATRRAIINSYF